jgi:hypothetical protein
VVPHPGQRDHPEDRWSNGSAPSGGDIPRAGQPRQRPRALRLAAAIGIIVGGLCVVLLTLALVVELGPRHPSKARPTPRASVLLYNGPHTAHPKPINITWLGNYEVAWSFTCRPGRTGTFKMALGRAALADGADVVASGSSRSGVWVGRSTPGRRSLFLVSDCSWKVKVFKPASTASAAPQPGPGDNRKLKHHHRTMVAIAHNRHHGHKKHPHMSKVRQRRPRHG